jgi:hypothetical protein
MSFPAATNDRETVRQVLQRIDDAWQQGRTDELNALFHEDMVIVGPGFQVL